MCVSKEGFTSARKYAGVYPGKTLLKPATFVIDRKKTIVYAYLNEDYRTRAPSDAVIEAVRKAAHWARQRGCLGIGAVSGVLSGLKTENAKGTARAKTRPAPGALPTQRERLRSAKWESSSQRTA